MNCQIYKAVFLDIYFSPIFTPYFDAGIFNVKNIERKRKIGIWAKNGAYFNCLTIVMGVNMVIKKYFGQFFEILPPLRYRQKEQNVKSNEIYHKILINF